MSFIESEIGKSNNADSLKAGQEACQEAVKKIGGNPDLIIVFSSVALDQEKMLQGVNSAAGKAIVIGCSDSGKIITEGPIKENVAVMAVKSDQIKFTAGVSMGVKANSHEAGKKVAEEVVQKAKEKISMFVMFPDGLTGNGAAIVRGAQETLGKHFPIMGGSAGDDFKFEKTYQDSRFLFSTPPFLILFQPYFYSPALIL
jgi:hypothetical protein